MSLRSTRARRHTRTAVGAIAGVGLVTAGQAVPAAATTPESASPAATASTVALPSNVTLLRTSTSLLGVHNWYRQLLDGFPVVGGLYAQHTVTQGLEQGQVTVWDGRVSVDSLASTSATVTVDAAIAAAVAYTKGTPRTAVAPTLWVLPGTQTRLVWKVTTVTTGTVAESHVSYVDAHTGEVVQSVVESQSDRPDAEFVNGKASVFDPNPVVKLQDEDLTDRNDSDAAVPAKGYSDRKLKHLNKSHTLVGKWARITNSDIASSQNDVYNYKRSNDDFEQVMGYYALDTQQSYYRKLGFKDINAEAQKIGTNTFSDDNSFYSPSQDQIETGTGGVDDAEDPEVTWHEGGHATQDDQIPGFGQGNEAGSIGEGFGDYIAVTLGQKFGKDTNLTPTTCVMDWDATSYTGGPKHCLRTTDTSKMYPDDLQGEVHADGEIWSHALWDMNRSLGRNRATTAILEGQFNFSPSINMPNAATQIVNATKALYGASDAAKARKAFEDRGIL